MKANNEYTKAINWKLFYRNVFALVIPIAIQNLINVGVTATDVIMLGKVGEKVLSGASLAGQIQYIMTLIFYGVTSGATVLTAQYWGKKDTRTIEKVLGMGLSAGLIVAVVFAGAALGMPETLMRIYTSDPEVIAEGVKYLRIVGFSYVFMAVMEQCIFEMQQHGAEHMRAFAERIQMVRGRLKELRNLKLLSRKEAGAYGVFDVDESKLVISCQGRMTGENLSECLRRDYAIEMEMCGADYAVAILTFLDSEEHLERLVEALLEMDRKIGMTKDFRESNEKYGRAVTFVPEIFMTPAEAFNAPFERIRLEKSAGRISGEFIYLYPPGIPIITPGECMTEEIIRQVLHDRDIGLPVQGMEDQTVRYLQVVKADETKQ